MPDRRRPRAAYLARNQLTPRVAVYQPKGKKLLYTITIGIFEPVFLATDTFGDLYVANRLSKNVTLHVPNYKSYSLVISKGIDVPRKLQFDPAGNLNVVDAGHVTVYAPRSGTLLRTIENGLTHPLALTFDLEGDLFVLNYNPHIPQTDIVKYAAGSTAPGRTFSSTEFISADEVAYGPDGYLYVATEKLIAVLDPSSGSTVRTITTGIYGPIILTLDTHIVSRFYSIVGMVAEVAPGKTKPKRVFETGMYYPSSVAFGAAAAP